MTTETFSNRTIRLLREIPLDKHDGFLDWAVNGMPVRSETEKQEIIKVIKEIWCDTTISGFKT